MIYGLGGCLKWDSFFYLVLAYVLASYYIGFQLSEVQMLGAQDTAPCPVPLLYFIELKTAIKV